ncbi:hypothetical protein ACHAPT_012258 [Fusarium lateritium]
MSIEHQTLALRERSYTALDFPEFQVKIDSKDYTLTSLPEAFSKEKEHQFTKRTAEILDTIKVIYLVIGRDLKWLETSGAWRNQTGGDHQWTPCHFMLAVDCMLAVCDHQLKQIGRIKPEHLNLESHTEPNQGKSLNELLKEVQCDAEAVDSQRGEVAEVTGLWRQDVEMQLKWPAASPIAILEYLILNTKSCRERFDRAAAKKPSKLRRALKSLHKSEFKGKMTDITVRSTVKGKHKSVIDKFDPPMHFFCFGYDKHGKKVHNKAIVGATQERLKSWPQLWKIRNTAWERHVGEAVPLWAAFIEKLVGLEKSIRDEVEEAVKETLPSSGTASKDDEKKIRAAQAGPIKEFRVKIMKVITGIETAEDSGIEQPFPRLRACTGHLGQAFLQQDDDSLKTNPCCMSCVITIGYAEVIFPNHDEGDLQDSTEAYMIEMRRHTPHSCAEVEASMYCDHFSQPGEPGWRWWGVKGLA